MQINRRKELYTAAAAVLFGKCSRANGRRCLVAQLERPLLTGHTTTSPSAVRTLEKKPRYPTKFNLPIVN